ncbi:MAG TPA: ROK family protein [Bacteroidia bacterium]|nr:ROK family protein [Bacteroidia bacterium]
MKNRIVIGADIGGTNTALGLVNERGEIISEVKFSTRAYDKPQGLVQALSAEIKCRIDELEGRGLLCGVGLGAPNGNIYSGMVEEAPNLRWKGNVDLRTMFSEALNVPVVLTNDANAAAIGEMLYGGAKGMKNFVVITIGTGLGSGIVVNGELLYGHSGFAGEMGHTIAVREGRLCTCGRRGCLEAYVSARGIRQTTLEVLTGRKHPSALRDLSPEQLSPKNVAQAAREGDPIALEIFEFTGEILGRHLADTVAYLSPEAIFFYGGVSGAGDVLLEPARRALEANVLGVFKGRTSLVPSALQGRSAAILGAAALAWKTFCVPVKVN